MRNVRFLAILVLELAQSVLAVDNTWDYAVLVSAAVQTSPPQITLRWSQDTAAVPDSYTVYRKSVSAASWGTGTVLPGAVTSFTDNNVAVGASYEYQIFKTNAAYHSSGYGYLYAGLNAPMVENRGTVVLIVDNTYAMELANELGRLQQDLVGDGWTVLRHDVGRNDSVVNVKNLIQADYNADAASVKAVFLFGHVPVPYSGDFAADFHMPAHQGAWPADVYYGDMGGSWTDILVNDTGAESSRNWNVPGDGKFDQSYAPSAVELEVGRVDLSNLTAFSQGERELLRQYLNKDHNYRHRLITAQRRGLVHDDLGVRNGEAYAATAWRNFAPWFGSANISAVPAGQWFSTLASQSYLCAYGGGAGSYTSISGLSQTGPYDEGTTWDFAATDTIAVFYLFTGSWLADWDSENNFLRSALATQTFGLAAVYAGLPHWFGQHMGLGETVGFSTRLTQNNGPNGLYRNQINDSAGLVHVALMGDPTLRLHPVAPASALTGTMNSSEIRLNWTASADSVLGYYVYRAPSATGPFTRLTSSPVSGTSFSDPRISFLATSASASTPTSTYMLRAIKLESTSSGTYFNPSQGVFVTVSDSTPPPDTTPPIVAITAPANNATVSGSSVTVSASASDNVRVAGVQFRLDGASLGSEITTAPYRLNWNTASTANGSHSLTAVARDAAGNQTTSTAVKVTVSNSSSAVTVWVDDAVPAGAWSGADGGDSWQWVSNNPTPVSGAAAHQSNLGSGIHYHYFADASATVTINSGDTLISYVLLDSANPPREIMLQWFDGASWDHRAYWGENLMVWGADGTASQRPMGGMPAVGQWVRLEVPASLVGLEGRTLSGMNFILYNGRATWDYTGKSGP